MVKLKINGQEVEAGRDSSILYAAKAAGITIPTLCHIKGLEPYGGCRMCLVEIEGVSRLQTACTTKVNEGMSVLTETDEINKARKAMLEFLLINHPLDCPVCDKAGECLLQDEAARYGASEGRFAEGKRVHPENLNDPFIVRNMQRCILCTRCTRMCGEGQGAYAISVTGRGAHSFVEPFSHDKYNCEYCGNCLTVCPVGAIMSRLHRHNYRPWYVEKEVETVCGFCGVGCTTYLQMRGTTIIRTQPMLGTGVNKGLLCARGRFGYDYIESESRLKTPMIRVNGVLEPVSWEKALQYIVTRLKEVKSQHPPKAIAAVASGMCSNEDNYMLQKLIRFVIGSNNIDSTARLAYAPSKTYIEKIFGAAATANVIADIEKADGVFVAGGDPTAINPVLGVQIRSAWRHGAKVVVSGQPGGLGNFINYSLNSVPHHEETVLNTIVIGLAEMKGYSGTNPYIEKKIKALRVPCEPELKATGVTLESMEEAIDDLSRLKKPVVVIGPALLQSGIPSKNLFLVAAIAYLTDARIYLLSKKPNYRGLIDMGCVPDAIAGGLPVRPGQIKLKNSVTMSVPADKGLNLFEMIEGALSGGLKALYVLGENLVFNLPDREKTEKALSSLDLLIVQDIFTNETTRHAHVVLPAAAWSEKDGTMTNLGGRIQFLRKGASDSVGRSEWRVIAEIAKALGMNETYRDSKEVWEEMTQVSVLHAASDYEDIKDGGLMWPYGSVQFQGGAEDFEVEGIGILPEVKSEPCEGPLKLYLLPERSLFHSGSTTRKSRALLSVSPEPYLSLNPEEALRLGLNDSDTVRVRTSRGSAVVTIKIIMDVPERAAILSNTFEKVNFNSLAGYSVDPVLNCMALTDNEAVIELI
ncbi:MAG: molybdopterin-dependent oxidoreductase [Candidatus Magnetominusculus sp. LBB02]|nr:molybdopterin-dependent oxidoreductase [Candidatus Magnetominusculus sp. LBB02]